MPSGAVTAGLVCAAPEASSVFEANAVIGVVVLTPRYAATVRSDLAKLDDVTVTEASAAVAVFVQARVAMALPLRLSTRVQPGGPV